MISIPSPFMKALSNWYRILKFFFPLLHTKYITENVNGFLDNDFHKKRISFIETPLRTLLFTKVSLKSIGLSISEKIQNYFLFPIIHNISYE